MKTFIFGLIIGATISSSYFLFFTEKEKLRETIVEYVMFESKHRSWFTLASDHPEIFDPLQEFDTLNQQLVEIDQSNKPLAVLPAPEFADDLPETLETIPPGEFKVSWKTHREAIRTRVFIYDHKGRIVQTNSTPGNVLYIRKVPYSSPGEDSLRYTVRLASQSSTGDWGRLSSGKTLWVYKDHFENLLIPTDEDLKIGRKLASEGLPLPISKKKKREPTRKKRGYKAPTILNITIED